MISDRVDGKDLDEAIDEGIIEFSQPIHSRFRFSHALIRDTAYGEIKTIRRTQLHNQVRGILLSMYGKEADSHAAEKRTALFSGCGK